VKYNPLDARVVLVDGAVALFISDAESGVAILRSLARLTKLAVVAAQQLDIEKAKHASPENRVPSDRPLQREDHDCGGGPGEDRSGEGGPLRGSVGGSPRRDPGEGGDIPERMLRHQRLPGAAPEE